MDRRSLLSGIFKAALAGSALSVADTAFAASLGMDKYVEILNIQADIIKSNEQFKIRELNMDRDLYTDMMAPKLGHLFAFSLEHFQGDAETPEVCQQCSYMLNNPLTVDVYSTEGLKDIMDVLIPVMITRNLFAYHKVAVNLGQVPHMRAFMDRYKKALTWDIRFKA